MLSLSHCETMLNSVKEKENIKKIEVFFNPKTALQCVCVCVCWGGNSEVLHFNIVTVPFKLENKYH